MSLLEIAKAPLRSKLRLNFACQNWLQKRSNQGKKEILHDMTDEWAVLYFLKT